MGRLDKKICIITGASSGIGATTARLFAQEGAKVALTDIKVEFGEQVSNDIGSSAKFFPQDVSMENDWQRVMQGVLSEYGRLDVLVNNAGILVSGTIESSTVDDFHRANSVMVDGVFLGCKYAIAQMKNTGGGSIINLSSIAAEIGQPHFLPYSAAKGAVRTISKSVAVHCQMHKYNIRCNSVLPGAIQTPMFDEVKNASRKYLPPELLKPSPAGRADPSAIANMILYLASDESSFVNGAEMVVDNALSIQ